MLGARGRKNKEIAEEVRRGKSLWRESQRARNRDEQTERYGRVKAIKITFS